MASTPLQISIAGITLILFLATSIILVLSGNVLASFLLIIVILILNLMIRLRCSNYIIGSFWGLSLAGLGSLLVVSSILADNINTFLISEVLPLSKDELFYGYSLYMLNLISYGGLLLLGSAALERPRRKFLKHNREYIKSSRDIPTAVPLVILFLFAVVQYIRSSAGIGFMGGEASNVSVIGTLLTRLQSYILPILLISVIVFAHKKSVRQLATLCILIYPLFGLLNGSKSSIVPAVLILSSYYLTKLENLRSILSLRVGIGVFLLIPLLLLILGFLFCLGLEIRSTVNSGASLDPEVINNAFDLMNSSVSIISQAVVLRFTSLLSFIMNIRYEQSGQNIFPILRSMSNDFPVWYSKNVWMIPFENDFRAPGYLGLFALYGPYASFFIPAIFVFSYLYLVYSVLPCLGRGSLPTAIFFSYTFCLNLIDGRFAPQDFITLLVSGLISSLLLGMFKCVVPPGFSAAEKGM